MKNKIKKVKSHNFFTKNKFQIFKIMQNYEKMKDE